MTFSRRVRSLAVPTFYLLLALIALHQPLFNAATHLPGDRVTDYYHFHWNYWWIRHALAHGLDVYQTNYVFFPFVSSTIFHTLAAFWFPLWALIEPLAGTFAAFNAIFTTAITLCGVTFYAFLRYEGVSRGLALMGGAMLALSPLIFFAVHWSMTSLIAWFWLPLALLTWAMIVRARRWPSMLAWAVLMGCTLWTMLITDLQYAVYLAFVIVPYGLWTLIRFPNRIRQGIGGLAAVGVALTLLWFGGTLPALLDADRAGFAPTPPERAVAIPFPLGYVWHTEGGNVPLGAVVLPLATAAFMIALRWRDRPVQTAHSPAWLWGAMLFPPLILSAGASVQVGSVNILMPYTLFHEAFGGLFRYPERFGVLITLTGALFSLKILTAALKDRPPLHKPLALILLFVIAADSRLFGSVAVQPQPPHYETYAQMGREPYEYVVIEVPTGGSSGEGIVGIPEYSALQFYGTVHGKRMINGHLSRVNTGHYWWLRTDDAMMAWLGQRRFLEPDTVAAQLAERVYTYPVGYLLIHSRMIDPYAPTLTEITGFLNAQTDSLCPPTLERDLIAYRTRWHPDGCGTRTPSREIDGTFRIDIGSPDDVRYILSGFYPSEPIFDFRVRWTGGGSSAVVRVDLPPSAYRVMITAQAYAVARMLTLTIENTPLGETAISADALRAYTFTLPADTVGVGRDLDLTLTFDADPLLSAGDQAGDSRVLALMIDSITFSPE
ncbi:MAG: hypothetical protein SF162_14950 [bacterium]|nr:hypothetical protein [bacterium]